jgi:putative phosphoesterase
MRIAIIADIHANADALMAVLSAASSAQVDLLLVAGDLVGYYFEPRRTLGLLNSWEKPIYVVRGNHEEMLLAAYQSAATLAQITARYGPGIQIALDQLSASELNWLASLPHPLVINDFGCSILLCHGSPSSTNQYVYPNSPLNDIMNCLDLALDILVMGHTHYPMVKALNTCLVVNPGSVGQPRNRMPGAHWALFDTDSRSVECLVESYDITSLQEKCIQLAPEFPYLSQVLSRI